MSSYNPYRLKNPCEAEFRHFAEVNPREMKFHLVDEAYTPGMRCRAAVATGACAGDAAIEILFPLLIDPSVPSVVKEGALQGLEEGARLSYEAIEFFGDVFVAPFVS